MCAHLQGRIHRIIERNRAEARFLSSMDFGITTPARVEDPELDALLDTLDDVVPDDEPSPAPANDNPAAPALTRRLVTKSPAPARTRKRRTGLRQREDARDMRSHGRASEDEAVEHPAPPSPTPTSPSPSHTQTKKTKPKARTTITTPGRRARMIAPWKDAGELPRLIAVNRGLAELGVPFAFSLNIDPALILAANDNARGALDYLRRRVALALKRAFGKTPPMWLCVETDDDGRPHLHGGLALNDNHDPAHVEAVLAKAGGAWTRKGSAPADVRVQWEPDGWAVYPLKRMARTRRHLREAASLGPDARVPLVSWSGDLLEVGRRVHEEARRAIGRR